MAARKGRSPMAASITQQSIEQASTALDQLPEKPKTNWSLREAINQLQGTINTALERGYSYQEIADMLGEQGIRISPASLKSYLAASGRDTTSTTPKRRRTSKTVTEEIPFVPEEASEESAPEASESSEAPPAPKKTRGPRTATKAKTTTSAQGKGTATKTPSRRKKTVAASAS